MTKPKPVAKLSFEDALAELEEIVSELEQGEAPLDESIASFERGVALSRRCEDRLGEAEKKLAVLLKQGNRIVEVDMESGETLDEREDLGEEITPAAPTKPDAPSPKAKNPGAQQSLIGGLGDDDIPF